ncbi:MAG: glycosyltransferase family 2 protein [Bacteroidetes bacterium]|nr:glycosyltransferase family 2 protein [Bacteroidota bacterium]
MNNFVSVIIPNYNGMEHLGECLGSLIEQTFGSFDITVVDNGSTDNSVNFITENYPSVNVLKLNRNYGFARGANEGIKNVLMNTCSEYILLLNNDVVCSRDFIENFLKGFKNKNVLSCACRMMNYYDRTVIDDCGITFNRYGHPFALCHGEKYDASFKRGEGITGCCAGAGLYKKEVFKKIGLFDENFIAYYEDVDLAVRIKIQGYECGYADDAVCYHKRGGSYGKVKFYDTEMCSRNLVFIWAKNYPVGFIFRKTPLFISGEIRRYHHLLKNFFLREALFSFKGLIRGVCGVLGMLKKRRMYSSAEKEICEKIF